MSYVANSFGGLRLQTNTVSQVAKKLKCSERTVQQMAKDGRLEAFKDMNTKSWQITARSVDAFKDKIKSVDDTYSEISKSNKYITENNSTCESSEFDIIEPDNIENKEEKNKISEVINPIFYTNDNNDDNFKNILKVLTDNYGRPKELSYISIKF